MIRASCGWDSEADLYLYGPTIGVQVGFDRRYDPHSDKVPELPARTWLALVDTGALDCCIDSELALNLELPIVDQWEVSGVGGAMEVNAHLAQIYIPSLNYIVYGSFAGVHLLAGGSPHTAIIGRSLLQHFKMDYDGPSGAVSLSR